ncbi:MAG: MCE family protein [Deltaproteobacteria bacterium]|nr:MCE family protein [Deltaproteobacteria bacterium]
MRRELKVGIFLFLGLLTLVFLVFLVGEERHLFARKVTLRSRFRDVAGLKVGSPVRMGGVDIGQVDDIQFPENPADPFIRVRFSIVAEQLPRVRRDSVARIVSKGLLGDKALDVSMGAANALPIAEDGTVRGEESDDMATTLHNASEALGRANDVLRNVQEVTRPIANERLGNDILALVHDLRTVAHQVAEGPGTVHTLLTDDTTARRLEGTLAATQDTARRLSTTAGHVEALAREARSGHGLVHALVYDREGERLVHSAADLAQEGSTVLRDVRTGDGSLHQVIYGQEAAQALLNVNRATADLRDIVHDVRLGRGTVGALLVDPSLYEDLKSLVGNVQRNEILRALVRFSIHNDENRGPGVQAEPAPSPAGGAPRP